MDSAQGKEGAAAVARDPAMGGSAARKHGLRLGAAGCTHPCDGTRVGAAAGMRWRKKAGERLKQQGWLSAGG